MNIAALIARHALAEPSRPAIDGSGERFSYAVLDDGVRRLANRLRSGGAGVGDLVAVQVRDTPAHLVALLAVARIGAVAIPLDWRTAPPEIRRISERFKPKLVLTDDARTLAAGGSAVPVGNLSQTEPDDARPASLLDSPLVYGLTSGTTGEPKGIVTTHEEMFGRFVAFAVGRIIDRDDRFLVPLPLVFDAGRALSLSLLTLGAEVKLFPTLFEPQELVDAVNAAGASALIVTPKTSRALLGIAVNGSHLMPKLRLYVSTAGKLQPEERADIRARVAPQMIDYYGTTGGGPVALIANAEEGSLPTAVGRLAPGIEVEIVDEAGGVVANAGVGRIRMRGPGVTRSFAGIAAPMGDEGLRDGWYYPGDIGSFGESGILHLTGRTAEMIKRGGLMIHAQEVEYVLSLYGPVVEAAVVGIPTDRSDEEVAAFVVLREPVETGEILRHCRQNLASYKVPQHIAIVETLPRNTTGKVVKAELLKLHGTRA
ncbi:MAG: class I adenylate-forming enzyme family protein [Bauldia sp.]